MKTLIILRHAKSSWENAHLSDKERPLNSRGITDAGLVGEELKNSGILPNRILVSPAERAQSTAIIVAGTIGFPLNDLQTENLIYGARESDMLRLIRDTPSTGNILMVVGHNPTYTGLVNHLGDKWLNNLPTCGCVAFSSEVDDWTGFGRQKEKEEFFIRPKNLREE